MKLCLSILFACIAGFVAKAQPCSGVVATFPYNENFEATNGAWTTGGTSSDWAWGTPTKQVINGASSGSKCWVTGGLNNSSYNNSENAWLMSPCFDFSALVNPEISFKVFWETERRFDGATFQYSIDNGNSWVVLGNANSNNCDILNWYNTAAVTYLSNLPAWSGNVQSNSGSCLGGNGSSTWVTAKHPLTTLAGRPNVRFRFLFGAGSTCNAYDGFAVDDIAIKEAVAGAVSIDWACQTQRAIMFSTTSNCISSYLWNFGDPVSGSNNNSTAASPIHDFSNAGQYTVSLTATFANGATSTSTTNVVIIAATKNVTWPGACTNTADGTLTVTPTGSNTPYFYTWNTNPPQTTASINNVGVGSYSVVVSSQNACSITENFTLAASGNIEINPIVTNSVCGPGKGSVITTVAGGTGPYSFLWSNNAVSSAILNLTVGAYFVTVTDANGCTKAGGPYNIINENRQIAVSLGADKEICSGESVTLSPGNYQSYLWQDGTTNSSFTTNILGSYYVTVTNQDGCSGSDTLKVLAADCRDIYFPSAFTPNNDGRNDLFGPLGNIGNLQQYLLQVYNRYGQLIFSSTNPTQKWDGFYKGEPMQTGNYIWIAQYMLANQWQQRKGSLLLIR